MPEPSCPPGGTMVSSFLQSGAVHQDGSGTGQRPKTVFGRLTVRTGPGPGQVVKSGSWRCIGFRFPDIGLIDIPASFDLALVHVFRQGHVILLLSVVGKRVCRCPNQFASLSFSPNDTTFESLRPIRFRDRSTRARKTCLKKRIFLNGAIRRAVFWDQEEIALGIELVLRNSIASPDVCGPGGEYRNSKCGCFFLVQFFGRQGGVRLTGMGWAAKCQIGAGKRRGRKRSWHIGRLVMLTPLHRLSIGPYVEYGMQFALSMVREAWSLQVSRDVP